jgi:lysophospholipase L1-like esterase
VGSSRFACKVGNNGFVYSDMIRFTWLFPLVFASSLAARDVPPLPESLSAYVLDEAPETKELLLRKGDSLAICGDSITEQKLYSVLLETYLTACLPDLAITCRQYGWSGEQAAGFLGRMESDVLRFKPTVATTCYGMNDFRYVPFDEGIAAEYKKNQMAVVEAFKEIGCRVVLGSPAIIDSVPSWVKTASGTKEDLNLCLSRYRNLDIGIARNMDVAFADNYRPMLLANQSAKARYGPDFRITGKDGVHPGWAGHVLMAYAYLKGLGVDGDLGSVSFDDASGKATTTGGHEVLTSENGTIRIRSTRLPFSPGPGPTDKDDSIRAGLALVPFDDDLNRFMLTLKSPKAANYKVTWGEQSRTFTTKQLEGGINLAKEFDNNPLVPAFNTIRDAVSKKQAYETRQIKMLAHGPEGMTDADATFALTEKVRAPLEKAITDAMQPIEHVLVIAAHP